jgi:hypothetical protein
LWATLLVKPGDWWAPTRVGRTSDRHTPVTVARHDRALAQKGTPMLYASLRPVPLALLLLLGACQAASSPSPTVTPASASPSAAEMTIALKGDFHPVDDEASGVAELVQLADGSYQIVFESFSIAATENLKVYLVTNEDVTASTDVDTDMVIDLGDLMGTSGMQVYPFPPEMNADVMTYQTVVIWDEPMGHAIAAAPLGQP